MAWMTWKKSTSNVRRGHTHFAALVAFVAVQGFFVWQAEPPPDEYKPLPPDREREQEVLDILARFQAARHAYEVRNVAYQHFQAFSSRQCLSAGQEPYSGYVGQANVRYQAWDALADAANEAYGSAYRLSRLSDLREIIGDDLFDNGIMPHPMPFLDFQKRD